METMKTVSLLGSAAVSFLLVIVMHYFPWRQILHKELPRIPAYFLGVLAIATPLTVLLAIFPEWLNSEVILTFWVICGAAGAGTILCYNLDALIRHKARADESEEREQKLLQMRMRSHNDKDE